MERTSGSGCGARESATTGAREVSSSRRPAAARVLAATAPASAIATIRSPERQRQEHREGQAGSRQRACRDRRRQERSGDRHGGPRREQDEGPARREPARLGDATPPEASAQGIQVAHSRLLCLPHDELVGVLPEGHDCLRQPGPDIGRAPRRAVGAGSCEEVSRGSGGREESH